MKSTNVRSLIFRAGVAARRWWLRGLAWVSPSLASRLATHWFFTPPRARSARIDRELASAHAFEVPTADGTLRAWAWGSGPVVLLVHGWGGLGGQMRSFVDPLVGRGYRVVTFDGPGHGQSGGRYASVVHFADAIARLSETVGTPAAIVAHSMGGAATAVALLRGLRPGRVVFIGPPANVEDWLDQFARALGLSAALTGRIRARIEEWVGYGVEDLRIPAIAPALDVPLLLVHDEHDAEVSIANGRAIAEAWPGATLVTTRGLGHRRILRDADVIDCVARFVEGRDDVDQALRQSAAAGRRRSHSIAADAATRPA